MFSSRTIVLHIKSYENISRRCATPTTSLRFNFRMDLTAGDSGASTSWQPDSDAGWISDTEAARLGHRHPTSRQLGSVLTGSNLRKTAMLILTATLYAVDRLTGTPLFSSNIFVLPISSVGKAEFLVTLNFPINEDHFQRVFVGTVWSTKQSWVSELEASDDLRACPRCNAQIVRIDGLKDSTLPNGSAFHSQQKRCKRSTFRQNTMLRDLVSCIVMGSLTSHSLVPNLLQRLVTMGAYACPPVRGRALKELQQD